jgi:hypothetical protein
VLQLHLLGPQLLEALGIDQCLRRRAGKDAQGRLVVRPEAVPALPRGDHDAPDTVLVDHGHDEHRFRPARLAHDEAALVRVGVGEQQRLAMLGHPAGQALADA